MKGAWIAFSYEHAGATMTAWDVFNEGKGVCRPPTAFPCPKWLQSLKSTANRVDRQHTDIPRKVIDQIRASVTSRVWRLGLVE
jgi:hypothetical protein